MISLLIIFYYPTLNIARHGKTSQKFSSRHALWNLPEVMIKTERYFVYENCFLRSTLDRRQFVTKEPARKTICKVRGIAKENVQLLITETDTKRPTSSKWRENGIFSASVHLKCRKRSEAINKNWAKVIKWPLLIRF